MNPDQHATEYTDEAISAHPVEPRSISQRFADLPTWKIGDEDPSIMHVQSYLRRFEYLSADEPVAAGSLDLPTSEALVRFQQHYQISETGEFDEATRQEMVETTRPICGTHHSTSPSIMFKADLGDWDKRDFIYAFNPKTAPSTSNPNQTLSFEDARAAVKRAFNTWSKATDLSNNPIGLRFVELPEGQDLMDADFLIEWVPAKHDETVEGDWLIHDKENMSDTSAHAAFPPTSAGGEPDDNPFSKPPLPIHFNAQAEYTDGTPRIWKPIDVEKVALHEIGHALGLEHPKIEDNTLEPGEKAVMENVFPAFTDLQEDDREGIATLYPAPGPERFNAIWNKGSNLRRSAWGLTRDQLHDEIDKQKAESYRPQAVNAYVLPKGERYNAIFQKLDKDVKYSTRRTREDFNVRHSELTGQGFKLTDVSTFIWNGEERWNGVWVKDSVNIFESVLAQTSEEISQSIDQYQAKDFRPVMVNAYVLPSGEVRWNGIFVKEDQLGGPRRWKLRRNKTREEFNQLAAEIEAEDYQLIHINTFVLSNGEGERWNGYWEKLDSRWRGVWGWVKIDAERRVANLEKKGYQPWVLNAYVIPPALTGTELASFQPPLQANLRPVILGVAVDENRAYATRYFETIQPPHEAMGTGKLLVLDRVTLQTIGEITVGRQPRDLAVNPRTNKIYVINRGDATISVIDGASLTVIKTIEIKQGPTNIAVNSVLNRIYVSNWFRQQIHVINGETDEQLEPIPVGPGPLGLTVDETTNRLYVALSNLSFEPHVTALGVIIDKGDQRQLERILPLGAELNQPIDVAVDPEGDRIYVGNLGSAGDGTNGVQPNVMVLQRSTLDRIATIPVSGPARTIACNSDARQVFVGTDRGVHVINASLLEVERMIPVGKAPWTIAVAGGTARQVFVGDALTGDVTRLA